MMTANPIESSNGMISCPTCATKPQYYLEHEVSKLPYYDVSPLKHYLIYNQPDVVLTASSGSGMTYEVPKSETSLWQLSWPLLFGILFMMLYNYLTRNR